MKAVTTDSFEQDVLEADGPVVVDFWAPWCGPCKVAMPKVEALSEGREDATFVKINVDENPELAKKYGIRGIPTFMVFNEGGEVTTITAADMEAIKAALDDLA